MKKKIVALLLAAALVISPNVGNAVQALAATVLTEDNMAGAILDMKGRLGIGDEYDQFNYSFYENSKGANWEFYWNITGTNNSAYAYCDEQGHIINYSKYIYEENKSIIPTYTTDELIDTAKAAIARIEPEIADSLAYKSVSCRTYNNSYEYYFCRIENGIEMPENYVNIAINNQTKEVVEYRAQWLYGAEIPSADKLIGKDEAAKKVGKKVNMQLRYYITYDENGDAKAFLAYTPDTGYIAVDAVSGKVYTQKNYWGEQNKASDMAMAESTDSGSGDVPRLSEAELAKIAELENLKTSEEAVELIKANKRLFVDESINSISANLYNDGKDRYYWNITMRDNRPYDYSSNDTYRAYTSARVDAKTGDILYYKASLKSYYNFTDEEVSTLKANYTKTQCKNTAEEFLKECNADRFANTTLSSTQKTHAIAYDYYTNEYTYAGFEFSYDRVNEDIPVNGNYMDIAVDAVSGKVFSYYCNWNDDVKLPSSKGIIDADAAFDKYIGFDGFDLVYEIETTYVSGSSYYGDDAEQIVRLVYRTAISPNFVDAFTGKQLTWNGTEYEPVNNNFEYTDIAGSKYERAIKILASMGIGFEGNEFKPDQVITRDEFQKLANGLSSYIGFNDYTISGDKALTRQMAAKAVIGYMGLDKLSELKIYKTGCSDESKISKDCLGAVALAKGLGIMKASNKKFKPTSKVTRGQAAQILLNALGVEL